MRWIPDSIKRKGDEVQSENSKQPLYDGIAGKTEGDREDQTEHDPHDRELSGHHAAGEKHCRGAGRE